MAVNIQSAAKLAATSGVKALVYGAAGSGKTTLLPGLPQPLIISAEAGLLSIAGSNADYVSISSMDELAEVYSFLTNSADAAKYQSIALDSLSEIAEVLLADEKRIAKDPRQAYGAMQEQMAALVRSFRDIAGKHVLMTSKLDRIQDESGRLLYAPSMPGNKTAQQLPYFFDLVMAMRIERDSDGALQRYLQCNADESWLAKDRSGKLDQFELPDIGAIIGKIAS